MIKEEDLMESIDGLFRLVFDNIYRILEYMYDAHIVLEDGALFFPLAAVNISKDLKIPSTTTWRYLKILQKNGFIESGHKKCSYNITYKGAYIVKTMKKIKKGLEESFLEM